MQLTRDTRPNANLITGLDAGGLRIRERVYTSSLIVSADRVVEDWPIQGAADMNDGHWQDVLALEPEIVLFGSGASLQFPPTEALAPLLSRGSGVEVMDTAAACRTYNLLLTEGRSVVAALIIG